MQEGEGEERKDSSEGIWLVLIWKYCFTSSELNYWSELAVLREQAERHRQPRWARSGRQICHRDHGEHMNPWSAERCSCPFILRIKSASLLLLDWDFILRGSVSGGECESFETLPLSLFLCPVSCYHCGSVHVYCYKTRRSEGGGGRRKANMWQ